MESATKNQTDSIPRLTNLDYFSEGLIAVELGGTFEKVRTGLIKIAKAEGVSDIGIARSGYTVGKRVEFPDRFTYWTNARDVLSELMNLEMIENASIPSKKEYVEKYRNVSYRLTEKGKRLLDQATQDYDEFRDTLFREMYARHLYLRTLLEKLAVRDIIIPAYKIGSRVQTERRVALEKIIEDIGKWFDEKNIQGLQHSSNKKELLDYVDQHLKDRAQIGVKNSDAIRIANDKLEQLFLRAIGITFDTVTFDNLVKLCTQFWIINSSFHVPTIEGRVIYSTANIAIKKNSLILERRGLSKVMPQVVNIIRDEFLTRKKDFVAIHELRAAVCYKLRINDEVFDHVLTGIYYQEYPSDFSLVLLRDLPGMIPPSAHPLEIGAKRFYTLALKKKTKEE